MTTIRLRGVVLFSSLLALACGGSTPRDPVPTQPGMDVQVLFVDGGTIQVLADGGSAADGGGATAGDLAVMPGDVALIAGDAEAPAAADSKVMPQPATNHPAGSVACSAPHVGWRCWNVTLKNPLNGVDYTLQFRWNRVGASDTRATALWLAGGNGTWAASLIDEALPVQTRLDSEQRIRSIDIDFIDAAVPGVPHTGGYWKALDGYRVASKIYDVAVRHLLAEGLLDGEYVTHVGGSNGANLAAFALAYHDAEDYLDQAVFNAGPISIDLRDECGAATSPAHIDVGGATLGSEIAVLADRWMGWDGSASQRYCQRRVAPPVDAAGMSNLDAVARRSFPTLTVHAIVGQQDGFGPWILRANRKWFDGLRARHQTLDCYPNLGHEMHWERTYELVARGPQMTAQRQVASACTDFPVPTGSAGIVGQLDRVTGDGQTTLVQGWACLSGYYKSIAVHLYAGGPAGQGTIVKGIAAADLNEDAVNVACKTSKVAHRFTFRLAPEEVAAHAGEAIYVHGIAPTSTYPNLTIGRSGQVRLPTFEVKGYVDGLSADGSTLRGWACAEGYHRAIGVHVYLGGAAGQGTFLKGATASAVSEVAVSSQCGTTGVAHRFAIPLSAAERAAHAGRAIYVHGISPVQGPNNLLANSGTVTVR